MLPLGVAGRRARGCGGTAGRRPAAAAGVPSRAGGTRRSRAGRRTRGGSPNAARRSPCRRSSRALAAESLRALRARWPWRQLPIRRPVESRSVADPERPGRAPSPPTPRQAFGRLPRVRRRSCGRPVAEHDDPQRVARAVLAHDAEHVVVGTTPARRRARPSRRPCALRPRAAPAPGVTTATYAPDVGLQVPQLHQVRRDRLRLHTHERDPRRPPGAQVGRARAPPRRSRSRSRCCWPSSGRRSRC